MTEQGAWDLPYTGEQWADFPPRILRESRLFGPTYVSLSVGETNGGGSTHHILAAGLIAA